MTTNGSAASPAKGKGAVVTGAVLLVLGIVLGVLGVAVFGGTAKEIAGTTVAGTAAAPAEITADLKAATTYAVYEQTGSATTVKPADVTVTAEDGTELTVSAPGQRLGHDVHEEASRAGRAAELLAVQDTTEGCDDLVVRGGVVGVVPRRLHGSSPPRADVPRRG